MCQGEESLVGWEKDMSERESRTKEEETIIFLYFLFPLLENFMTNVAATAV